MKKTTAFFLSLGVLSIIVGGIGSAFYGYRLKDTMFESTKEDYQIKDQKNIKEVQLTLSGNAEFIIQAGDSNQIMMETTGYMPKDAKSSLKVDERDGKLLVSASSQQTKKPKNTGLQLNVFSVWSSATVTIPKTAERVVINSADSSDVTLANLNANDLSVKTSTGDLSVSELNTKNLSLETSNGSINLTGNVLADEASLKSSTGDVYIRDFSSEKWSIITTNGDVSLDSVRGVGKVETATGDIQATNLKGEATVTSTNGEFTLYGPEVPKKLNVHLQQGDIQLYTDEILYDTSITTKTMFGDSKIFGKEHTSYKKGKETHVYDLTTKAGDISIDGPSEYEEDDA